MDHACNDSPGSGLAICFVRDHITKAGGVGLHGRSLWLPVWRERILHLVDGIMTMSIPPQITATRICENFLCRP